MTGSLFLFSNTNISCKFNLNVSCLTTGKSSRALCLWWNIPKFVKFCKICSAVYSEYKPYTIFQEDTIRDDC